MRSRLALVTKDRQVGLCARCLHAVVQESARGSTFWRCGRADEDERFLRYPPLPVLGCPGYEEGAPKQGGA